MAAILAKWGDTTVKLTISKVLQNGAFYVGEFDRAEPLNYSFENKQLKITVPDHLVKNSEL
jgi:hypothetical protein